MRRYEETHPWLKFQVSLDRCDPRFWMLLGEAQSKCQHIAGIPLRPSTAEKLHILFLAKGALATTAIEGNTLSEAEVIRQIEGTLQLPPSRQYQAKEVQNIIDACNRITQGVATGVFLDLSRGMIKDLNRQVLEGLELEEGVVPGEIREHSAGVPGYRGAPPEDCEYLLDRLCEWLNEMERTADQRSTIVHAIIRAVLAHLYLEWIHPFGDGNGRTGRLLEFQILISSGAPAPAAHLLSNYYNQTRPEYYRQLQRASASGGDVRPFLHYAATGFVEGLHQQLKEIQEQQLDVIWENYVVHTFADRRNRSGMRQRNLALGLSEFHEPITPSELLDKSPQVAGAYAGKTVRAVWRDIRLLVELGLVRREPGGVIANREAILAFLPVRRRDVLASVPEGKR